MSLRDLKFQYTHRINSHQETCPLFSKHLFDFSVKNVLFFSFFFVLFHLQTVTQSPEDHPFNFHCFRIQYCMHDHVLLIPHMPLSPSSFSPTSIYIHCQSTKAFKLLTIDGICKDLLLIQPQGVCYSPFSLISHIITFHIR